MAPREGAERDVLTLRPSRAEFSRPFSEFVRKVLRQHPDVPMFKVVPPPGWRPRRRPFPKLDSVEIATPIKQIVYGKGGAYRCILVEQKACTAARFKQLSESEGHTAPESKRGKDVGDALLERNFWSSVTINPPFYGADTPQSFFDEKLEYGWNLRHLEGCLLHSKHVPSIPGVTSPMTYFGMWKSFFSWHLEDADLFSVNYLHFGAPKIWYCVAPSQKARFERMAQSLYPELHRGCRAFMRHKDVLLSPQMLKTYGVEYTMAKHEPGEFIVLNAAAYHAGYNLGFNCAEAVNFALPEWVELGRRVVRCKCDALRDGVRLSMRLFGCDSESEEESEEEEESSDEAGGSSDEEEEEEEGEGARPRKRRAAGDPPSRAKPAPKRAKAAAAAAAGPAPPPRPKPRATKTALAAAAAAARQRSGRTSAEARARLTAVTARAKQRPAAQDEVAPTERVLASLGLARAAAAAMRAKHEARAAAAAAAAAAGQQREGGGGPKLEPAAAAAAAAAAAPAAVKPERRLRSDDGGQPRGPAPQVVVGESKSGRRYYFVVQQHTAAAPSGDGRVVLRGLEEGPDGLFRPGPEYWEERADSLVDVRTQWVGARGGRPGGWRLRTLATRILETELTAG
ncbi:hypothetical protein Rsub_09495 [Raphidocelis subcapitata]|uniref:Jumonji domain-containing protein n=1 Tax=Raphidocelis subcapitata TaxID=307507 RepID=A0A2V0PDI4_9CHLO|nr:hypothetical protein Rsub_09495 [Raphidocelis subcapitata]|eukprot:GBF97022.1 hypothetical protein Rsub_09495 [Raphidocelis subcapitata]